MSTLTDILQPILNERGISLSTWERGGGIMGTISFVQVDKPGREPHKLPVPVLLDRGETLEEAFARAVGDAETISIGESDFNLRGMGKRHGHYADYREVIEDSDHELRCEALREALPDDYDALIGKVREFRNRTAQLERSAAGIDISL